MIDYDEWRKAELEKDKTGDVHSSVKIAVQAAVASDKLTSDKNWDYFLSILQGFREQAEVGCASMDSQMWNPAVLNHETMIAIKMHHAYSQGLLDAIDQIMEVPKILVENGEHAQEIVKDFKLSYDA